MKKNKISSLFIKKEQNIQMIFFFPTKKVELQIQMQFKKKLNMDILRIYLLEVNF